MRTIVALGLGVLLGCGGSSEDPGPGEASTGAVEASSTGAVADDSGGESGGCEGEAGCACASGGTCVEDHVCAEGECVPLSGSCGNGVIDPDEACDDGNLTDADGCNADCRPSAELLWSHLIDGAGPHPEGARAVAMDSTDSLVVVGLENQEPELTAGWIAKLDRDGLFTWTDVFPYGCSGREVEVGPDDRILTVGVCVYDDWGFPGSWGRVYASDGTLEGDVNGTGWDAPQAAAFTALGEFIVSDGDELEVFVDLGHWQIEPAGHAAALVARPESGFVVAGYDFDGGVRQPWVAQYDHAGMAAPSRWSNRDAGDGIMGSCSAVALDGAGNVLVTGLEGPETAATLFVAKLTPDGTHLWTHTQQSELEGNFGVAVATDSKDRVVVSGQEIRDGDPRAWIGKYGPEGSLRWFAHQESAEVRGIAINSHDEIAVVGSQYGNTWIALLAP